VDGKTGEFTAYRMLEPTCFGFD